MRLSQLNTEQALDTLCELAPLATKIMADETLMDTLGKAADRKDMTRAGVLLLGAERLSKLVPILLKDHRQEVYGIVAALNGLDPEAVAAQNVLKTAVQLREIFKDRELLDFFKSCAEREQSA